MTGNNLTLAGDMARRVLTCRIDPGTDHPFAREFDLDPLVHTRKHRQEMAAAGLTIVRGWMTADAERAPGRMASFEMWDDIVRQAVAWVGREIRPGQFGDPMNAVFTAQSGDPEQETLGEMLLAWRELFGGDPVSSGEVLEVVSPVYGFQPTGSEVSLRDCLREFSERAIVSKKSLGRALGYRVGRIVGGLKLEGNKDPHTKTNLWRVVEVD